jgi:hypothetical protein
VADKEESMWVGWHVNGEDNVQWEEMRIQIKRQTQRKKIKYEF